MDAFYPQALGGFIMVMTEEGELIYLTESVSRHIGLTQKPLAEQPSERNFFLRVKSTLTSRGRTVNIKSAAWKVIHCRVTSVSWGGLHVAPCRQSDDSAVVEFPLDTCTFLTRHSMDLRFTHCEG
ncbi:hypothetical protein F7725_020427, partial [Dissostichus mawsoni]